MRLKHTRGPYRAYVIEFEQDHQGWRVIANPPRLRIGPAAARIQLTIGATALGGIPSPPSSAGISFSLDYFFYVAAPTNTFAQVDVSAIGFSFATVGAAASTAMSVKIVNQIFSVPSLSFQGPTFTASNAPLSVLTNHRLGKAQTEQKFSALPQ